MSSLVIYGNEFAGHLDNGLSPEWFKYRYLVEGDSWMDRSAMFHTSLLQCLAPVMDADHGSASDDFAQWVNTAFGWKKCIHQVLT